MAWLPPYVRGDGAPQATESLGRCTMLVCNSIASTKNVQVVLLKLANFVTGVILIILQYY